MPTEAQHNNEKPWKLSTNLLQTEQAEAGCHVKTASRRWSSPVAPQALE